MNSPDMTSRRISFDDIPESVDISREYDESER